MRFAGSVRRGAIIVSMLGAEAPMTSLPEGAFFGAVVRTAFIASEAVWELGFCSLMSLAKYSMAL